jgi:hypothetical protein
VLVPAPAPVAPPIKAADTSNPANIHRETVIVQAIVSDGFETHGAICSVLR